MKSWKKLVASGVFATALLAGPGPGAVGDLGLGPDPALAREPCEVKIEVCSEVDLVIWKGTVCVEFCL